MGFVISIDSSGVRNRRALCKLRNVVVSVGIELIDGRNGSEKERVNKLKIDNLQDR